MKGFVLSVKQAKKEDCIVILLTDTEIRSYYRFFGMRHSILKVGHLLNFEVEGENTQFLPRLRKLSLLEFSWTMDKNKKLLWDNFIQRIEIHLRDAKNIEDFYYHLLIQASQRWDKQNPKRLVCESYIELLTYEKRLSLEKHCLICQEAIQEDLAFIQGFKAVHAKCISNPRPSSPKVFECLKTQSTIFLEEVEVDILFAVLMKGF
jgi:hypothetical protein